MPWTVIIVGNESSWRMMPIVSADSPHVYENPEDAISNARREAETDEDRVKPSVVSPSYKGIDNSGRDAILMANFRADRAREILEALACPLTPCEETFPSRVARVSLCVRLSSLLCFFFFVGIVRQTHTHTQIYRYGYGEIFRRT